MLNSLSERIISYACQSCDTMIRTYSAPDLPPKGHFHYHQGVFLSGVLKMAALTNQEKYYAYVKEWVDSVVSPKGHIYHWDPLQLDDIQPGILLFPLYDRTKDQRYKTALDQLLNAIDKFPKNDLGGFWHKGDLPDQMWLDGLYMAGPIMIRYAQMFDKPAYIDVALKQIHLMLKYNFDPQTGLLYHAWDYSKVQAWSDPVTGCSPEFWGRSIGWVVIALVEAIERLGFDSPEYSYLRQSLTDLLNSLAKYQNQDDGRWYQVVDKGDQAGNWLENSCSCLFSAGFLHAWRHGWMDDKAYKIGMKGLEGVFQSLETKQGDLLVNHVCIGTGVGDYEFYCQRPTSVNDLHGVGAFLIMCEAAILAQQEANHLEFEQICDYMRYYFLEIKRRSVLMTAFYSSEIGVKVNRKIYRSTLPSQVPTFILWNTSLC